MEITVLSLIIQCIFLANGLLSVSLYSMMKMESLVRCT